MISAPHDSGSPHDSHVRGQLSARMGKGWRRRLGLSEVWVGSTLSSRLLVLLRWLAVAGQMATLVAAWRLGVAVPWSPAITALLVTMVTNAALSWWLKLVNGNVGEGFFHVLLWDVATLVFLLHWTGGLGNPFALFILVQLTLAAVALRASAVFFLGIFATIGCGWLWHENHPLQMRNGSPIPEPLLIQGHFAALFLAGVLVLCALLALRQRSQRLQVERERLRAGLEEQDRFLSIAALATGFAHEIATPLGIIALASDELEGAGADVVRQAVARCQEILIRLRSLGEHADVHSNTAVSVEEAVYTACLALPEDDRLRVRVSHKSPAASIACAGLLEALLVMLRNAIQSAPGSVVEIESESSGLYLRISVRDHGQGFTPEMLRHWGEPFRSTRAPGEGMGLGLFFVRRLAAAAGGYVQAGNHPEGGARVNFVVPVFQPGTETN